MTIAAAGPPQSRTKTRTINETASVPGASEAIKQTVSPPGDLLAASQHSHRPDPRGYVYLALMVFLGSTTALFATVAVRELPVGILPLLRFGFAGLCLIPFLTDPRALWRLVKFDGLRLCLVAALCVPINQSFFLNATRFGPNSHVGLFYAVCPLVVWTLAWALGHEKLDLRRLSGVLASIAGVSLIGLGNLWGGGASVAETRSVMVADLLLVGAVLSWGAYLTLSKPLISRHGALPVLAGTFLVGVLLELPIALVTLPGWLPMIGKASPAAWISLGILSILVTPLNLALQNLSLRRLDASQVATFTNAAPVLTVVWGVCFFHEALTATLVIGGLLTLGGIFWTSPPWSGRSPAARTHPVRIARP
jgi:drug/metabolite transporter (DMT)-like permease